MHSQKPSAESTWVELSVSEFLPGAGEALTIHVD